MAHLRLIDENEAEGPLREEYDAAIERAGKVFNILKAMSLNPRVLRASIELYKEIMFGESGLSRRERELLATVTSAIASCEANIHNLMMRMGSPDFHKFVFEIEVRDLAQLSDVLAALKLATGVSNVRRASIAEARGLSKLEWTAEPEMEPA